MQFNKLINSLLGEELSDREKRIQALRSARSSVLELGARVRIRDNYILPVSDGEIDIGGRVVTIIGHLPQTDEWFVVPEYCEPENWYVSKITIKTEDLITI